METRGGRAIARAFRTVAGGAVARVEFAAALGQGHQCERRMRPAPARSGGTRAEGGRVEGKVCFVRRAVARGAGVSFAFGSGERAAAAEGFQVGEKIAAGLVGAIG